jgi:hypothetical protein
VPVSNHPRVVGCWNLPDQKYRFSELQIYSDARGFWGAIGYCDSIETIAEMVVWRYVDDLSSIQQTKIIAD